MEIGHFKPRPFGDWAAVGSCGVSAARAIRGSVPVRVWPIPRSFPRKAVSCAVVCAVIAGSLAAAASIDESPGVIDEGFEGQATEWTVTESDVSHRVLDHRRDSAAPHRGDRCESIVVEAATGSVLRLGWPVGPLAAIDEFNASIWLRTNRPDIGFGVRIALPRTIDPKTGKPVTLLVIGTRSVAVGTWTRLQIGRIPDGISRQVAALRAEHGTPVDPAEAVVTELVFDLYASPGRYELAIDDLSLTGAIQIGTDPFQPVSSQPTAANPYGRPSRPAGHPVGISGMAVDRTQVHAALAHPEADVPARLAHGVFEVAGLPFFPRIIDHNGEPLTTLAGLGFNGIRCREPASADLLAEARRTGMWIICPPPRLPAIDPGEPESLPAFSPSWDRVLSWDMGTGLCGDDLGSLAETGRKVRACDFRPGRPLAAAADSAIRELSRHLDLIVARRTVLGTSMELEDYVEWLRQRPRLARPGTPMLAVIGTEYDATVTLQIRRLAGQTVMPVIDPESMVLTSLAAVTAGARGIVFASTSRLDATDQATTLRALACRETNLQLSAIEPWAASGRFASVAESSDPEVRAVVIESARTRIVVASRIVQGSQIVARRYHGDTPRDGEALTLVVPGVPEPHRAWEVTPLGLRPLKQKRVTGGSSLTLEDFHSRGYILMSGDPAVTGDMQRRIQQASRVATESLAALATRSVADATHRVSMLPPKALGVLPVASMLADAQAALAEGLATAMTDPPTSIRRLRRADSVAGQIGRLSWERGVMATGSFVSDALATSIATLPEHWTFVDASAAAVPGAEMLKSGSMDRLEDLDGAGWRHLAHTDSSIHTAVTVSREGAASGTGYVRMVARASGEPPVVVESPPVWITTPDVEVPAGKLVRIEADVHVPTTIEGSVDGLLVFDSFGGPALAERVGRTDGWRRLVLYRIAPGDSSTTAPFAVTFALTGLGEARLDAVSIRVLEKGLSSQIATSQQSTYPIHVGGQKSDGIGGVDRPTNGQVGGITAGSPPTTPRESTIAAPESVPNREVPSGPNLWPDLQLKWPGVSPLGNAGAPPPGPGGGRLDPFKRSRMSSE